MAPAQLTWPRRRGLTLVELLMVISIMTILMVVAVPMIRPAFQDRYLREAARQVNVYLAGAQARAAELGRPVGVWIERIDDTEFGSRHASRLYLAEVAPSFNGAALDSRATVTPLGAGVGRINFVTPNDEVVLHTLVAPNEKFTIKFDHRGHDYQGLRQPSGVWELLIPFGVPPGAADSGPGLPYEITRGPVRSSVAPLTLPGDSVIDLSVSGVGTSGQELNVVTAKPVIIVFAPTGRIDYVYLSDLAFRPFAPLHLLIGRKGKVVDPATVDMVDPQTANLADPTSLWITVSERTGAIITSDNADTSHLAPATPPVDRIAKAREFARFGVQKGGR